MTFGKLVIEKKYNSKVLFQLKKFLNQIN